MTKDIEFLCLANSTKYEGRCIAGLDIDTGEWVRPVSDREHRELRGNHYVTDRGYNPDPLDIISISLNDYVPDIHQPENWQVADCDWEILSRGLNKELAPLINESIHTGPAIFGDCNASIEYSSFKEEPADASLALIHTEKDKIEFYRQGFDGQSRVKFELNGVTYDLAITDPDWRREMLSRRTPGTKYVDEDEELLLTVSLAEKREETGRCHKLVPAVIPIQSDILD